MKTLLSCILLLFSTLAFATDYQEGCSIQINCVMPARPVSAATFSDTFTFSLGTVVIYSGAEAGTYTYVSSNSVDVYGERGSISCGRACSASYDLQITSASIDGVTLTPLTAYHWTLPLSLAPGTHVLSVQGTATGATYVAHETGYVMGLSYSFTPLPPCTDDCGGS